MMNRSIKIGKEIAIFGYVRKGKKEGKKEKGKKKEKMLFCRIATCISSGCEVTSNLK